MMKMKTNVSLLVAAALMIALLFKEVPILMVVSAPPGSQTNPNVPTPPPKPQKISKVDSSVEVWAA